jgi:REP element-mobilizing transposase RayT
MAARLSLDSRQPRRRLAERPQDPAVHLHAAEPRRLADGSRRNMRAEAIRAFVGTHAPRAIAVCCGEGDRVASSAWCTASPSAQRAIGVRARWQICCRIKMTARGRQLDLALRQRSWGGARDGAGRKPGPGRRRVAHSRRDSHDPRCPAHVTLRGGDGLPSLRSGRLFTALSAALAAAARDAFRVLHFSVQRDHVHLLVEADASSRFARGIQGLAIRAARAVNRVLGRRGAVWSDRYHARMLATPREVRNALVYVLANVKKHVPGTRGVDPRSSARWFDGWRRKVAATTEPSPVASARTWLAGVGWRRHGLIDVEEAPRAG